MLATPENYSRVIQMLSEAIRTCPQSTHAAERLSMYYLKRANMKLLQHAILPKQSKLTEQKRLEIISDYQDSLKLDSPENNDLNYESRIEKLTAIQQAYTINPPDKNLHKKITKLSQLIKQNVKVEYFVARAKAYADQQDKALASLDYLSAIWLIRLQMDTSSKYSQHELEKQLASLSITEEKTIPEKKPTEPAKPHKKKNLLLHNKKQNQRN